MISLAKEQVEQPCFAGIRSAGCDKTLDCNVCGLDVPHFEEGRAHACVVLVVMQVCGGNAGDLMRLVGQVADQGGDWDAGRHGHTAAAATFNGPLNCTAICNL
jgi:hypothetical protein